MMGVDYASKRATVTLSREELWLLRAGLSRNYGTEREARKAAALAERLRLEAAVLGDHSRSITIAEQVPVSYRVVIV